MRDELEPHLTEIEPGEAWTAPKVRKEFAVYSRMVDRFRGPAVGLAGDFEQLLLEIHRRLGTGANNFRNGPVMIRPDAAGNTVFFPHHGQCRRLLEQLHFFLSSNHYRAPTLCATVAYAAVIHAHPFTDGNGRTARTLYNLLASAGLGQRHFVAILSFTAVYRASFLIKVRRAIYRGDWSSLHAFFLTQQDIAARYSTAVNRGRAINIRKCAVIQEFLV
jgi:hypothetical protein